MRTRRFGHSGLFVIAVAVAVAGLAGSARALQPTDLWVIVEGPHAGVGLNAMAGTNVVPAALNPHTGADGTISPAKAGCDSDHFHGTLFEAPDVDSGGCGKGRAVLLGPGPSVARSVADAMTLEYGFLRTLGCDPPGARTVLTTAIASLDSAIAQMGTNPDYDKARKKLEKARDRDLEALGALEAFQQTPPQDAIAQEVEKGKIAEVIVKTRKDKQKAVATLVEDGLFQ